MKTLTIMSTLYTRKELSLSRGQELIRYGCLVMYVVFMFMKNIQEYINQKSLTRGFLFKTDEAGV